MQSGSHLVGEEDVLWQLGGRARDDDLKLVGRQCAPGGLLEGLLSGHGDGAPQPDGARDVVPPLIAHRPARGVGAGQHTDRARMQVTGIALYPEEP